MDLTIEKKFNKVVIGMVDPNEKVAEKSIKKLKKHGIEVVVDIKEEECIKLNDKIYKITNSICNFKKCYIF